MISIAQRTNSTDAKTRLEVLTEEVSASRLSLFASCRQKFYLKYVLGLVKPNTPALHVGRTLHGVLQSWSYARWRGDPTFKDRVKDVFDQRWVEEQQDQVIDWQDKEDKEREVAFNLLTHYLSETPIPENEKPAAVEVMLESELANGVRLIGVIDLVRGGDNRRIVDFKSSKVTPDPDRVAHLNEVQLSCYGLLYRSATDSTEKGFELHHLIKTKVPKLVVTSLPPITQQQIDRLHRQVDSYVEGVQREDWAYSPGLQCASCSFFQECRSHQ
jgi:CRISPR/Cas system-associated exonuclease Cas4 (RecB family)